MEHHIEDYHRWLLAAQGYCELDMFDAALAQIVAIPAELQDHPSVVEMRLVVLMQQRKWLPALRCGQKLCAVSPDNPCGFIHTAFVLHELGRTEEALRCLSSGPIVLQKDPTFFYNMACYECVLGRLDEARVHLAKCVAMDKKYRELAKTDPDLVSLKTQE